ncbi:hypothetical protein BC628DRAFT_1421468 [Trametes gibbosa]|nr:hypothetical protein BC628DRAFT_1421468 [Trametes gibbosa]
MKANSYLGAMATVAVLQAALSAAQTSLYIPGFDPQALTADIEGVDAQGRTTWRIGPGVTSGTFDDPAGLIGSATLVADATEAHLVYANTAVPVSLSEDCVIANGVATCSGVASAAGTEESIVVTETASAFEIQGGTAAAAATSAASVTAESSSSSQTAAPGTGSNSAGAGSGSGTPTATQGSGISATGPSPTASGSGASPSPTGNSNGAGQMGASMMVVSLSVIGLLSALFL